MTTTATKLANIMRYVTLVYNSIDYDTIIALCNTQSVFNS